MQSKAFHESRGLLVRKGKFAYDIELFQPEASQDLGFADSLIHLNVVPEWASSALHVASLHGREFKVARLSMPPAAHFQRSPQLVVTTVYTAVLAEDNILNGKWVSAARFIEEVEEQWASVLTALVSQLQHALGAGYISLNSTLSPGAKAKSVLQFKPSTPTQATSRAATHSTSPDNTTAPRTAERGVESGTTPTSKAKPDGFMNDDSGIHIGCSDYPRDLPADTEECSSCGSEDEGHTTPNAESATATPPLTWHPGEVALVKAGGRDVQAVLDSEGLQLGVISWHAPWIDSCIGIEPFLPRLAGRFRNVGVMQIDVEASMENKLLSYEKVLTRAESRRRGAKPVVRNGEHFPCITLHQPYNLVPTETFCGPTAIDRLATALASLPKESPMTVPVTPGGTSTNADSPSADSSGQSAVDSVGTSSTSSPASLVRRGLAQSREKLSSIAEVTKPADGERGDGAPDGAQTSQLSSEDTTTAGSSIFSPGLTTESSQSTGSTDDPLRLSRGAMEFKQVLRKGMKEGRKVVVSWERGLSLDLRRWQLIVDGDGSALYMAADVRANKHNQQLATSLGVKALPHLQVFDGMKMVKSMDANQLRAGNDNHSTVRSDTDTAVSLSLPSSSSKSEARPHEGSPQDPKPVPSPGQASQDSTSKGTDGQMSASSVDVPKQDRDNAGRDEARDTATKDSGIASPSGGNWDIATLLTNKGVKLADGRKGADSASGEITSFDPPTKPSVKGSDKKRFPNGVGIYWPRMPCLQCGCPWWLGEDWDAKCARCAWTAEGDGYDDDSNPLPKYKKKYAAFCALFKEGKTADWPA